DWSVPDRVVLHVLLHVAGFRRLVRRLSVSARARSAAARAAFSSLALLLSHALHLSGDGLPLRRARARASRAARRRAARRALRHAVGDAGLRRPSRRRRALGSLRPPDAGAARRVARAARLRARRPRAAPTAGARSLLRAGRLRAAGHPAPRPVAGERAPELPRPLVARASRSRREPRRARGL